MIPTLYLSSKSSRSFLFNCRSGPHIKNLSSSPGNLNRTRRLQNTSDAYSGGPTSKGDERGDRAEMHNLMNEFVPNGAAPLESDYSTFDRQLEYHMARDIAAVDKSRCRHGRCRAFFRFPVGVSGTVDSGMVRLSCPYLVQAVDRMEAEGFINLLNEEVKSDPKRLKSFLDANKEFSKIRHTITGPSERAMVVHHLGQEAANAFFSSGIVGVSSDKANDIKCMHAHLADGILRGFGKNLVATRIAELLSERGISINGGETCKHQCDPSVPPEAAAAVWWYSAAKNKAGMRRRKRINRMRLIKNMTMNGNKVRPGDVGMIPGLNE